MRETRASDGFFRLVVLATTCVVVFFAVDGLTNFVLSAGVSWSDGTRQGTLADKNISIAIASVSGNQPIVPVGGIYSRAETGLFVFDNPGYQEARLTIYEEKPVDVVWFDTSLYVISVEKNFDLSLTDQLVTSPINEQALFLLVTPSGFINETGVGRGDRLLLI